MPDPITSHLHNPNPSYLPAPNSTGLSAIMASLMESPDIRRKREARQLSDEQIRDLGLLVGRSMSRWRGLNDLRRSLDDGDDLLLTMGLAEIQQCFVDGTKSVIQRTMAGYWLEQA